MQHRLDSLQAQGNENIIAQLEADLSNLKQAYEQELGKSHTNTQNLERLASENNGLMNQINSFLADIENLNSLLTSKERDLQETNSTWQDERIQLEQQISELSEQNSKIYGQIESFLDRAPSSFSLEDLDIIDDKFGQVIKVLKEQKDSLVLELESSKQECRKIKFKLDQTQKDLEEASAKSKTDNKEEENRKIKEKHEQLSLIKESNATLRNENTRLLTQVTNLERELSQVIEPLNSQIRDLKADLASKSKLLDVFQAQSKKSDDSW